MTRILFFLLVALSGGSQAFSLTSESPISTAVHRSAPGRQLQAAVASDGLSFMAVWKDERFGGSLDADIYGSRIASDGSVLDPGGIPIAPTHTEDTDPHIVWNGDHYLAIFGTRYFGLGVTAIQISREGEIIGGRAVVRPRNVFDTALAWNGSVYLIVWRESPPANVVPPIQARLFDRDLNPISDELTIGSGLAASAASNGDDFLVSWIDNGRAMMRTISRSGELGITTTIGAAAIGRPAVASDGMGYAVAYPTATGLAVMLTAGARTELTFEVPTFPDIAITGTGSRYVVAWNQRQRTYSNLFAAELDGSLGVALPPVEIVTNESSQSKPAIAVSGGRVVLLWSNETGEVDVRGTFFTPRPADSFLVSTGLGPQRILGAAAAGDVHGLIWFEGEAGSSRLMFGRVGPNGQPLDGGGIDLGIAGAASIASSGALFVVVYTTYPGISAVRITKDGRLLDTTPLVITANGSSPVAASNGRDFVVAWMRQAAYAVTLSAAGSVSAEALLSPAITDDRVSYRVQRIVWTGRQYVALLMQNVIVVPCNRRVCPVDQELQAHAFDSALNRTVSAVPMRGVSASAGGIWAADLATNGSDLLFVWTEAGGLTIQRADADSLSRLSSSVIGTGSYNIAATWDGSDYVLAWTHYALESNSTELRIYPLGGSPSAVFLATGNRSSGWYAHSGSNALVAYTRFTVPTPRAHPGTLERGFFRFTDAPHRRIARGNR